MNIYKKIQKIKQKELELKNKEEIIQRRKQYEQHILSYWKIWISENISIIMVLLIVAVIVIGTYEYSKKSEIKDVPQQLTEAIEVQPNQNCDIDTEIGDFNKKNDAVYIYSYNPWKGEQREYKLNYDKQYPEGKVTVKKKFTSVAELCKYLEDNK